MVGLVLTIIGLILTVGLLLLKIKHKNLLLFIAETRNKTELLKHSSEVLMLKARIQSLELKNTSLSTPHLTRATTGRSSTYPSLGLTGMTGSHPRPSRVSTTSGVHIMSREEIEKYLLSAKGEIEFDVEPVTISEPKPEPVDTTLVDWIEKKQ